ncbi:MAG TPA: dockerin type I domain-containing protein, partial [Candidatus Paceibacterota bacterium]|nr:dockerin type I domain-containing protein [Candidatus Paceibacterota bacterium]
STSTPPGTTALRLRLNVRDASLSFPAGETLRLQFSDSTSTGWTDVGATTSWAFFDNPSVADGQLIITTVLPTSNVGESYGESNPSAAAPTQILPTQLGEWDWAIQNLSASTTDNWYFRLVSATGTPLAGYDNYPALIGVPYVPPVQPPPVGVVVGGGGTPIFIPPSTSSKPINPPPIRVKIPGKEQPPSPCDSTLVQRVDFSGDCRVDMTDLSILVYYFDRGGSEIASYDLNGDGVIDLYDVSIMMYYWTD